MQEGQGRESTFEPLQNEFSCGKMGKISPLILRSCIICIQGMQKTASHRYALRIDIG